MKQDSVSSTSERKFKPTLNSVPKLPIKYEGTTENYSDMQVKKKITPMNHSSESYKKLSCTKTREKTKRKKTVIGSRVAGNSVQKTSEANVQDKALQKPPEQAN